MSGGAADTRVSIPNNVRKVIQEIKKTLGSRHSEEFVYTTLKDCDMNAKEAGQRLKMIHDIREIAGKHSVEDVYTMLKDCNMDPNEAAQRLLYIDTFHEVKKKHDRRKTISSDSSEEYKHTRGNQWRGAKGGRGTFYSSKVFNDVGAGTILSSGKEYGVTKRQERDLRLTLPVHSGKENNVTHVTNSAVDVSSVPAISNGSCSHKLAAKLSADVSSFTSDPVVAPPQNAQHTCSVGTIKCEIVKRSDSRDLNAGLPAGKKFSADQVVAGTVPVIAEAADSGNGRQLKSVVVEKNQESSQPLSLLNQNSSQVNHDQDNKPLKVAASEHLIVPITNTHPVPGVAELTEVTPKLDMTLEKLATSSRQPVIFPDHLQVPENFKTQFTFGSLDAIPDDCRPLSVNESAQKNEVVTEPSTSATTVQEGEIQDHPLPNLSENVLPSQDNISSDPAPKHEQEKLDMMGGFQNPVLQSTRDYSCAFMPHLMGPQFVHLDAPELQSGSSLVASASGPTPATQPATGAQSSIPLSPPVFPYFRQPYLNYVPYNPYFMHMYLPQNAHLLNHGVFPLQPSTGNVHMQAAGVKFPVPSQYKQGSNAGSLVHLGVPFGYGSYGSSVGYGAAVTHRSSANEDRTASQTKDDTLHSAVQQMQGEDPQVWAPAAGQDHVPNLLPNYFYNFPQGQPMVFSPLQPLMYQSHSTVEPMVPPPSSYQQPQHPTQINWNTALLHKETS